MKKLIYLIMGLGLLFTACNPMDDIYTAIDAQQEVITGDVVYTLTTDDYDALNLSYGSFSSEDDAKTMLPAFLSEKYPVWGKGSSALLGFQLYIGKAFNTKDYKLTQADYTLSGSNLLGFQFDATPGDFLPGILTDNISSPSEGTYANANYYQFTGSAYVLTPSVSLEENFDYGATAGDLTTISTNWTAHSGSTKVGYITTSLSMVDYPSSNVGGSITINSSSSEDVNSAFTTITSGKVYASALVNLSAVGSGNYFFHIMEAANTQPYAQFRARVGAKDNGSGKILFGIGASSSSLTYGTTPFDLNTTYLLVSSYDIATGISNLYVLTTAKTTEPGTPEASNTGTSGTSISAVAIRQSSNIPTATLDGIRVANSWSSIMSNGPFEDEVIGTKESYNSYYKYSGGTWTEATDIYALTTEDYDAMGTASGQPGKYNNFDSSMDIDTYVTTFLGIKYPYAADGDTMKVLYKYYSGSAQTRGNLYTFMDGAWTAYQSTISTTLQFGHDGIKWVPDNTIKYTLTSDDYVYISEQLTGNADFANVSLPNLANYGDFDYNWTSDQLLQAMGILADHIDPTAAEGQKYVFTYLLYDNGLNTKTMSVIKTGGVWVLNN
ncbi:hypothetical protein [Lutibacter sp.]|uniref:hypothetical protein n=1 Tax=Lutibacter sp. TaxID=1925666 RepID=UPI0025C3EA13|nr:hypothetical protein [Lutibacter sp.]MCF6182400.1 hypothetical protein [Lutibacter sp.]